MKKWNHSRLLPFLVQLITIFFTVCSIAFADNNTPEGFASVPALGLDGTTGGAGGNIVTVTNVADFISYIDNSEPLIIQVAGTIELTSMVGINSNKSIIGIGNQGVINGGGFNISNKSNIIIRNLLFQNSVDDAINVQEYSHHIWIDHCDFTNAYDGLCDIKRGSDYITVSWNKFYNHQKTCLLGHSDNNSAQDSTHLLVTYHHNWFNGTNSRHPRVRFSGLAHVYNNYYNNNSYGVASTMHANVLVENNYFYVVTDPTLVGYAASSPGLLEQTGNIFDNCAHAPEDSGTVPSPPYAYALDNTADIPSIVQNGAGRVGFVTTIALIDKFPVKSYELYQNYPNPFNPSTTIEFHVPKSGIVTLSIYNVLGQLITTVLDQRIESGTHRITFKAENFASGFYFYKLQAEDFVEVKKMLLMK
jgi:pectate lyase